MSVSYTKPTKDINKRRAAVKITVTVAVAVLGLAMIVPFLWMLVASFKRPGDILTFPIRWFPNYWYPDNYRYLFSAQNEIGLLYFNSIKITVINVLGAVLTSSLAAYAYAKMRFKGRNLLFLIMIATLIIPNQATYIPRFTIFTWLGLVNTHAALILPGLYAVVGTFLMTQFFKEIPDEIIESAVVDGAGDLRIWWQVLLPMAKPAIATFVITVFSFHWNDYETPLIFIHNKKLATIPLGLANFTDENGAMYHYIMAMTAVSIIPLFAIFLVGQNYFIKGLTAGAVKG